MIASTAKRLRSDVQGITTLVGRRLGQTLTIKLRVWDLAMFANDTQDKRLQNQVIWSHNLEDWGEKF